MSGTSDRAIQALEDMLDNALRALRYYRETGERWRDDEKTVDAILRRIGNLGEAARRMPITERASYEEIKWRDIVGMRDRVVHGYDDVDLDILGHVLREDLPELIARLRALGVGES